MYSFTKFAAVALAIAATGSANVIQRGADATTATPVTGTPYPTQPNDPASHPTGVRTIEYTCEQQQRIYGNGLYDFWAYQLNCAQRVSSGKVLSSGTSSLSDCLKDCNGNKYCNYANHQQSTNSCVLYNSVDKTSLLLDSDWDGFNLTSY